MFAVMHSLVLLIYLLRFGKSGFLGICLAGFNVPLFYCSNNNITFR
jgi:hypothetical protein